MKGFDMDMDMRRYPLSVKTRNLVRNCRHPAYECGDDTFIGDYAFRDAWSRISVLKSIKTAPGPDECFSLYDCDARILFTKLLGLDIEYCCQSDEQKACAQLYNSMNYYRSHIEEVFYQTGTRPLPPVEGHCFIHFADTDVLSIRYELRNNSLTDVSLRLRFHSTGDCGENWDGQIHGHGFTFSNVQKVLKKYRTTATLSFFEKSLQFKMHETTFCSNWIEHTILPGETLLLPVVVDFDIESKSPPLRISMVIKRSLKDVVQETEATYARLPELPSIFRRFDSLVLKAAGGLRSLSYMERDINGKKVPVIHVVKTGIGACYFWDSAFTLLGLGVTGDLDSAYGMVRILLDGISPEGKPPIRYHSGQYLLGFQQPILAWGIGQFSDFISDKNFLDDCYKPLVRYVRFWLEKCNVDGSGLVKYPSGQGHCWDDSLRWQEDFPICFRAKEKWFNKHWGKMRPDYFESVDTNTHLYLECATLSKMAKRLGFLDDAETWKTQAERLKQLIHQRLYNEEAGVYMDRNITNGRFTGMVTPASFMPLYANIAPRDIARRLCRDYLLNPDRFYTTLPFPTLDRSHPAFRSGGFLAKYSEFPGALVNHAYWIGRTWPHVSFWMIGALYHSGLEQEADEAAIKILDAINRNEAIFECYDSLTGSGVGHAEYNWSCAAVLALAYQLYNKSPVGFS